MPLSASFSILTNFSVVSWNWCIRISSFHSTNLPPHTPTTRPFLLWRWRWWATALVRCPNHQQPLLMECYILVQQQHIYSSRITREDGNIDLMIDPSFWRPSFHSEADGLMDTHGFLMCKFQDVLLMSLLFLYVLFVAAMIMKGLWSWITALRSERVRSAKGCVINWPQELAACWWTVFQFRKIDCLDHYVWVIDYITLKKLLTASDVLIFPSVTFSFQEYGEVASPIPNARSVDLKMSTAHYCSYYYYQHCLTVRLVEPRAIQGLQWLVKHAVPLAC